MNGILAVHDPGLFQQLALLLVPILPVLFLAFGRAVKCCQAPSAFLGRIRGTTMSTSDVFFLFNHDALGREVLFLSGFGCFRHVHRNLGRRHLEISPLSRH